MKLSIIIPIHNTARFLPTLFSSLLHQELNKGEYEVILINDGSTDDSQHLCEDFIKNNPLLNVRYFEQSNSGVSAARNSGIHVAQGKYLHFVDSDDILKNGAYRYLLDKYYSMDADYIGFDLEWLDLRNKKESCFQVLNIDKGDSVSLKTGEDHILEATWPSSALVGLYKSSFLRQYSIKFPVGVVVGEDVFFNFDFFSNNPSCITTSCKAYVYCMREQSAITTISRDKAEEWCDSYFTVLSHMAELGGGIIGIQRVINHHAVNFSFKLLLFGLAGKRFKYWAAQFMSSTFFPLKGSNFTCKFANLMFSYPRMYPIVSWLYRNVFYSIYNRLSTR